MGESLSIPPEHLEHLNLGFDSRLELGEWRIAGVPCLGGSEAVTIDHDCTSELVNEADSAGAAGTSVLIL